MRKMQEDQTEKIEALKKKLEEAQKLAEPPKEEVPKEEPKERDLILDPLLPHEIGYVVPPKTSPEEIKAIKDELKKNGLKNAKIIKSKFVPPDPTAHITGMNIKWIDNRYQIHGVPGIPGGNIITLRSLLNVDELIADIEDARKNFNQKEMISTKK